MGDNDIKISPNSNLNTPQFLKINTYYVNSTADALTLTNCPTKTGFHLRVYGKDTEFDKENTQVWVYRIREIIDLSGNVWRQNVNSNGTVGNFTYGLWRKVLRENDIALDNTTIYKFTTQNYGTTPPAPVPGQTIIALFTYN